MKLFFFVYVAKLKLNDIVYKKLGISICSHSSELVLKYNVECLNEHLRVVSITTKLWSYFPGFSSRLAGISEDVTLENTHENITECARSTQHDSDQESLDYQDGIQLYYVKYAYKMCLTCPT